MRKCIQHSIEMDMYKSRTSHSHKKKPQNRPHFLDSTHQFTLRRK